MQLLSFSKDIRRLREKTKEGKACGRLRSGMGKIESDRKKRQEEREEELDKVAPVIKARGARGDSNWLETGYLFMILERFILWQKQTSSEKGSRTYRGV